MSVELTEMTEPYKLDDLPVGHEVLDAMRDRWVKQEDGTWDFPEDGLMAPLTSRELLHVWGPVKVDLSYLDETPEPSAVERIRAAGAEVARLFSLSAEEAGEALAKFAEEFDPYPAKQELQDRLNSWLKGRNPGEPINWRGLA